MRRQRHLPIAAPERQAGFSLLELTLVVLILGIMAAVMIPDSSPSTEHRLDLAAQIQADAMRFARSEAIRRGEPMGFRQENGPRRMRVYRLDTSTAPWTTIFDVHHPVTKQPYDILLGHNPTTENVTVTANPDFAGICNTPGTVYFDKHGMARCADPENVRVNQYEVTLTLAGSSRTVTLHGPNGRVRIQ